MNKTELITYLMDEYQIALQAIQAERLWNQQEDERIELLEDEFKKDGKQAWFHRDYYRGRHVPKAELNRIRLMLQKAMLEVERDEKLYR